MHDDYMRIVSYGLPEVRTIDLSGFPSLGQEGRSQLDVIVDRYGRLIFDQDKGENPEKGPDENCGDGGLGVPDRLPKGPKSVPGKAAKPFPPLEDRLAQMQHQVI